MKEQNFFVYYVILAVLQMFICNYLHLGAYVVLSILPIMVLCIPTKYSTTAVLFIAFATGFFIDLLAEGTMGINTAAILPVALLRRTLCDAIFGDELVSQKENISREKYGFSKVFFASVLVQAIFLAVYVWADAGNARPLLFTLERFAISLAVGVIVSIPVGDTLTQEARK